MRRLTWLATSALLLGVCGAVCITALSGRSTVMAADTPRNGARMTTDQFDQLFNEVKNWGRWGKDDQLASMNLITDAKRKQAAQLVKTGTVMSLAHTPIITEKAPDAN